MIGIDTNVLVRAVIGDDAQQAAHAARFLRARDETNPAFINPVVAAEFVWVLRAAYRMPRHVIVDILRSMIESAALPPPIGIGARLRPQGARACPSG